MKKTYQKPTITVVSVMTQNMLAASTELTIGESYRGGDIQSKGRGNSADDDFDGLW